MARGSGDLYTKEMEHDHDTIDSPVAGMAARIATLWRAQGEDFLAEHHAEAVADIDRLRTAVVVATDTPVAAAERLIERLRRLDAAAIDRVAAGRTDAVVDLTGPEPTVTVPNEEDGMQPRAWRQECRRCGQYFPDELLVQAGEKVRPLCLDCALVFAGARRRR
ncbi:MAG: hypothetical protein QOG87_3311 [Actinomycetota bacterium]|jgi:hypothetical protein